MERAGRLLIVNADDFGQSDGINRGIVEAFDHGIVTSASLMVRWPAVEAAAKYARSRPDLSLGLHIDLGEWYLRDGTWVPRYEVLPSETAEHVSAELRRQVERFRALTGEDPTHIDSHQHVHVADYARDATLEIAAELAVPVRHLTRAIAYCGGFYGQGGDGSPNPEAIQVESLLELLRGLPDGVTELACHPGYADGRTTTYGAPRADEIRALCDSRVRGAIESEGIELRSFRAAAAPG
jgi:predicted glycoside hydrolase/deacetylase ChbG (UPF0249 family)